MHDDGSVCDFEEYPSINSFLNRQKKERNPKMMNCPLCGQEGLIGNYRRKKAKRFHKWQTSISIVIIISIRWRGDYVF
jgi:hypothetical protein